MPSVWFTFGTISTSLLVSVPFVVDHLGDEVGADGLTVLVKRDVAVGGVRTSVDRARPEGLLAVTEIAVDLVEALLARR